MAIAFSNPVLVSEVVFEKFKAPDLDANKLTFAVEGRVSTNLFGQKLRNVPDRIDGVFTLMPLYLR